MIRTTVTRTGRAGPVYRSLVPCRVRHTVDRSLSHWVLCWRTARPTPSGLGRSFEYEAPLDGKYPTKAAAERAAKAIRAEPERPRRETQRLGTVG